MAVEKADDGARAEAAFGNAEDHARLGLDFSIDDLPAQAAGAGGHDVVQAGLGVAGTAVAGLGVGEDDELAGAFDFGGPEDDVLVDVGANIRAVEAAIGSNEAFEDDAAVAADVHAVD